MHIRYMICKVYKEKEEVQPEEPDAKLQIETTPDEWKAYYLAKSILRGLADSERVTIRDAVNYPGYGIKVYQRQGG